MPEKISQPSSETPLEEEKRVRRKVLEDMKELGRGENPLPQEDWDLVWVLSGHSVDIAEEFNEDSSGKEVIFDHADKTAEKDVAKKINESRERLETGMKLAKEITAKRLKKPADELTLADIKNSGPDIYWNATDWGNDNLRERIREGFLDKYDFPSEKIIVSANLGIQHTADQFEKIEEKVIEGRRKIVIVSDTYHLPRVKRYLHKKDSKITDENSLLYASQPKRVPIGKALEEIKKVPKYIKKGFLPKE